MIKAGKVYISVFFFVFIFICFILKAEKFMLLAYLALLVHELFHLSFAVKMKIPIVRIVVLPFGINIKIKDKLSYIYELILCIMGPVGSLVVGVLALYIYKNSGVFDIKYFADANFSLFIINSIPIYPLDGGRIFKRILEEKEGHFRAAKISLWVSQGCVFVIFAFIFAAIVYSEFNVSIVVLCCFLISEISKQKNAAVKSYAELLAYSKEKLEKNLSVKIREIAVSENCYVKNILKNLSDGLYTVVSVADKNGKIIARITETELIEAITIQKREKTEGIIYISQAARVLKKYKN